MAASPKDELYIVPRPQRSLGLGGAILRALAVMAVLDLALMLVPIDEVVSPAPTTQEAPVEEAPALPEAIAPKAAASEPAAPETTAETKDAAASTPPSPEANIGLAGTSAPSDPAPDPAMPAAKPDIHPQVASAPPAEDAADAPGPSVVLPSAKPRPPEDAQPKPAIRRAPRRTVAQQEVAEPRLRILPAAASPRGNPPPCKPYSAETTLAGEARQVRGIACPEPNGTWRIVTERSALE